MLLVPPAAAAIGIALPFTGLSHLLGFTPLPAAFFLVLVVLTVVYMVLVDVAKSLFYRAYDATTAPGARPRPGPAADRQRSARRLHRRAAPFTAYRLTALGRWLLPRRSPAGTPTRAAAGHAETGDRTSAIR